MPARVPSAFGQACYAQTMLVLITDQFFSGRFLRRQKEPSPRVRIASPLPVRQMLDVSLITTH
jgi:hypothetical protein